MSHQSIALPVLPAASPSRAVDRPSDGSALPSWLTNGLLMLASGVLCALAGASAWLSYHAQVAYVLAHNGNLAAQARVWAVLLDVGTAGVSLLRLYETLQRRPGTTTRISLAGCIAASVTMNVLHTSSGSPGGLLVAAVPPVMYAVILEHLLTNLRSSLVADEQQRSMWRTLALWINFPALMWRRRRSVLRLDAEMTLSVLEPNAGDDSTRCDPAFMTTKVEQATVADRKPAITPMVRRSRRGRGPGPKRVAFEAALVHQMRCGDLRLFSGDERERNAAAYQAAASLPMPLSRGAARRYVVQALPRLGDVTAAGGPSEPDAAADAE